MAYFTTKEVAMYLHLNEKKIYAMVAEGKLPAARPTSWISSTASRAWWLDHRIDFLAGLTS